MFILIAGRASNIISTRGWRVILERAKASSGYLLMEFIKLDKAEVLKNRDKEGKEKDKLMKDVIEVIGTKIGNQPEWRPVETTMKKLTLTYRHPYINDDDDVFFDEPMEGGE